MVLITFDNIRIQFDVIVEKGIADAINTSFNDVKATKMTSKRLYPIMDKVFYVVTIKHHIRFLLKGGEVVKLNGGASGIKGYTPVLVHTDSIVDGFNEIRVNIYKVVKDDLSTTTLKPGFDFKSKRDNYMTAMALTSSFTAGLSSGMG